MKKLRMCLLSLLTLSLVAGCGGNDTSDTPSGGDTAGKKTVTVANDVELSSMDTGLATDGTSFEAIAATIEGLYRLDADGNAVEGIAESTDVSEDGADLYLPFT